MKKKIIIGIIVVILALLGYGGYKVYHDYIYPIYQATHYSPEKLKEKTKSAKDIMKEETGLEVREMTDEEKQEIESGEKTEEEIYEKIINESAEKEKKATKDEKKYDANVVAAKYLAEIYSLEGAYEGKITALIATAKDEYYYLRKEQKVPKQDAIKQIASKYSGQINAMEGSCDAKFNEIISRMEQELKEKNCDTSIVASAKKAYEGEKESKRSYYMSLIMGK